MTPECPVGPWKILDVIHTLISVIHDLRQEMQDARNDLRVAKRDLEDAIAQRDHYKAALTKAEQPLRPKKRQHP